MPSERVRVIDLETAGGGPHDVCEIGWQDVVRGGDGRWRVDDQRGALLVNPGRAISADTMAIHHIRDVDVAGAPFWKQIAPSVLRPERGVVALAAHRAGFEMRYCTPSLTGGARWICMEMRPATVARSAAVLEPNAALSAHAGRARP